MARIPDGSAEDIDRAVKAAQGRVPGLVRAHARRARRATCRRFPPGLMARADELAKIIAQEVGMPLPLSKAIQAGLPAMNFGVYAKLGDRVPVRGAGRQLAGRARAGRRGRLHHAVELPAAPDRAPRSRRRSRPAARWCSSRARSRRSTRSSWPRWCSRSACRRACSTWSPATARWSARRSRRIPSVDMVSFTGSTRAGPARVGARRADDQARAPRARRQVGERGARRRRLREGGRRHGRRPAT